MLTATIWGIIAASSLTIGAVLGLVTPLAAATHRRKQGTGNAGMVLVMGAILDGIPEQTVLGVGMGAGNDVSIALLIAICLANIPESVGSASDMKTAGVPTRRIMGNCVAI